MNDLIGLVAVIAPFAMVVAIVVWPKVIRARERTEMQATLRAAIDKGQPLPAELVDAMAASQDKVDRRPPSSRSRDIRNGIIWLAVGVGLAAFSILNEMSWAGDNWDAEFSGGMLAFAAIPVTIGVAYLILSAFNKNKD
jgi:hypothetical protein